MTLAVLAFATPARGSVIPIPNVRQISVNEHGDAADAGLPFLFGRIGFSVADDGTAVFATPSSNLTSPTPPQDVAQVYLYADGNAGATLLSRGSDGAPGESGSAYPEIAPDADKVVFSTCATKLGTQPPGACGSVMRVRGTGGTAWLGPYFGVSARIGFSRDGAAVAIGYGGLGIPSAIDVVNTSTLAAQHATLVGGPDVGAPALSSQGRYVVAGSRDFDAGEPWQVNRWDTRSSGEDLVSARDPASSASTSVCASRFSECVASHGARPAVSADGNTVAFLSQETALTPNEWRDGTTNAIDAYVRDIRGGTTRRISLSPQESRCVGAATDSGPWLSADAHYAVYEAGLSNGQAPACGLVLVDLLASRWFEMTDDVLGWQGWRLSADGSFVVFTRRSCPDEPCVQAFRGGPGVLANALQHPLVVNGPPEPAPPPSPPPPPPPSKTPVVLITGITDTTRGQGRDGACDVGSMTALCKALTKRGREFPVYVVPSSATGDTVINHRADIDTNAASLARYLRAEVREPALLVGHSMGGLIARVAISRYGARPLSRGLVTVASPHTGSFGADIAQTARWLPCVASPGCEVLHAAGDFAAAHFGPDALADLTSVARGWDNLQLAPTGVPTWVFAGTACQGAGEPLYAYLFPNDGAVGKASALGHGARLGPVTEFTDRLWHSRSARTPAQHLPGCAANADVELESVAVANIVVNAASTLGTSNAARTMRARHPAGLASTAAAPAPSASSGRSGLTIHLVAASSRRVRRGTRVDAKDRALLAATPFDLSCPGHSVHAMPALGGRAFGVLDGASPCARPRLMGAARLTLFASTGDDVVSARLTRSGGRLVVTLTSRRRIVKAALVNDHAPIVARARRRSSGKVTLTVRIPRSGTLAVRASVAGREYQAPLSTLP